MLDLMIDLETTGLDPSHNAIIQIAAVRFDYETAQVGPIFNQSLEMPATRFWDQGTADWWLKQGDTLDRIISTARPAEDVMKAFATWCLDTSPALSGTAQRLWAKPISFEWPFLQSYCREFEVQIPFHYRNAVDLNSFCRGLANHPGAEPLDKKLPFVGVAHDAIDDVFHQITVALSAKYMVQQ